SVSTSRLKPKENKPKENKPKEVLKFCYIGALTNSTWHTIEELKRLYIKLKECSPIDTQLLIITTSDHTSIRKVFNSIDESEIVLTSTKTIEELNSKMEDVDFGLLPYKKAVNNIEDKIGY